MSKSISESVALPRLDTLVRRMKLRDPYRHMLRVVEDANAPRARFVVARGPWRWLLSALGCSGLTMPWRTVYVREDAFGLDEMEEHERVHLAQIDRYGPVMFSLRYLWGIARFGYRNSPLEIEAYAASDAFAKDKAMGFGKAPSPPPAQPVTPVPQQDDPAGINAQQKAAAIAKQRGGYEAHLLTQGNDAKNEKEIDQTQSNSLQPLGSGKSTLIG